MIEETADPRRGRRGRHHDRHRQMGGSARREQAIETIVVVVDGTDSAARVAGHLARALSASLVLWDRRPSEAVDWRDSAFADIDLQRIRAGERPAAELHQVAMAADLVVIGTTFQHHGPSIEAIAEASARGVLVVPHQVIEMPGDRVAIRWDGTPRAASALRDSLPLLRDAECIWIADVHGPAERGFEPSAAARYLERHGFDAYEIEADGCCLPELVAHQNLDLVIGAEAPTLLGRRSPESLAEMLRVPLLVSA